MQGIPLANGAEGRTITDQSAIDWHKAERAGSDLRRRISFRGDLLEPCADKLRTRGSEGRAAQ